MQLEGRKSYTMAPGGQCYRRWPRGEPGTNSRKGLIHKTGGRFREKVKLQLGMREELDELEEVKEETFQRRT